MPYLIQGTFQDFFEAFGYDEFYAGGTSSVEVLKDLERTLFLGTASDCQFHMDTWKDGAKSDHEHYTQGNMSAGNLFLMFGHQPFMSTNPELTESQQVYLYQKNRVSTAFAYVNKDKQLCGFGLYYLKNNPRKWMIGGIKNTNLLPSERQVSIITSVDPSPFIKKNTALSIEPVTIDDKQLSALGNGQYLEPYLRHLVNSDGTINVRAEVISFFLQMVRPADRFEENQALLDIFTNNIQAIMTNKALQILQQLPLKLSPSQILECLNIDGPLYKSVCLIPLYDESAAILEVSWLLAKDVQEQKDCLIKNLKNLKLDSKIVDLLQRDDESGTLFFKAVSELELACLDIRKRLLKESEEKYDACLDFERNYRKAMYAMLYDQVLTPSDKASFCDKIRGIEEPFLKALDVDANPWLRQTLMVLVNSLTLLFTFGMLNVWHKSVTGDFLFFCRPASSEALKVFDYHLIDTMSAPTA